jgi:hypothetical protein
MRSLVLVALLGAIPICVSAQRMTFSGPHFVGPDSHSVGPIRGPGEAAHRRSLPGPLLWFADPLFYSDALYSAGYPLASQPPVLILPILPAPPAAMPTPESSSSPTQPLLIELQGTRYVRVSGEETSSAKIKIKIATATEMKRKRKRIARDQAWSRPGAAIGPKATQPMAPAVLVFRDGRRQEVSDYAIADGILYARGDSYADGSSNQTIDLSALNLAQTLEANTDRGVKFVLPSSRNEVITRP